MATLALRDHSKQGVAMKTIRHTFGAAALLTSLAMPVHADSNKTDDWRGTCAAMQRLAQAIMKNRQNGIAMADMMAKSDVSGDATIKKLDEALIIEAYSLPRYSTDEMQQKSIEDFGNDTYLQCAKSHMEKAPL
jgi:hypothetical protein